MVSSSKFRASFGSIASACLRRAVSPGFALALSLPLLSGLVAVPGLGIEAAQAGRGPDSFADLAASVSDAVVNISANSDL